MIDTEEKHQVHKNVTCGATAKRSGSAPCPMLVSSTGLRLPLVGKARLFASSRWRKRLVCHKTQMKQSTVRVHPLMRRREISRQIIMWQMINLCWELESSDEDVYCRSRSFLRRHRIPDRSGSSHDGRTLHRWIHSAGWVSNTYCPTIPVSDLKYQCHCKVFRLCGILQFHMCLTFPTATQPASIELTVW